MTLLGMLRAFIKGTLLAPGVSGSGITVSVELLAGLQRRQAALLVFLLSAPVVGGAGRKQVYDVAAVPSVVDATKWARNLSLGPLAGAGLGG
jgi:undecaprenyl pyrophosphate phosphatase UppP